MIERKFVTLTEFRKHSQGHPLRAHGIWPRMRKFVPGWGYSKAEIDAFFEGYDAGKAQVHWDRVTNKPFPDLIANVLSDHDLAAHTALGLFDASSDVDHDQTTNVHQDVKTSASPTFASGVNIGNLTLANGSITDSNGGISFGDENLSTTGRIGIGSASVAGVLLNATSATDAYMRAIISDAGGYARFRAQGHSSKYFIEFYQFGSAYAGNDPIGVPNAGLALVYSGIDTSNIVIRTSASATANILFGTGNPIAERLRIGPLGNIGIGQITFGTNAAKILAIGTGVTPESSPADCFQMYSKDINGGHAACHIRNENNTIIKLYQQAHIIDADGNLADITTKFNTLLSYLENAGLLASS